jgi:acetyl-CoA carboxylase biotin carboxylase subunit
MIAKLIVWDADRESARNRMVRALGEFIIEGISTTLGFHLEIVQSAAFAASEYNTRWVGERAREEIAV